MTWRYAGLSLLFTAALCARFLTEWVLEQTSLTPQVSTISYGSDPESLLATGQTLSLTCVDLWSLQLLTGVSDSLAHEILTQRDRVIAAARSRPLSEALQLVHGVGKKNAVGLSQYLNTKAACQATQPFEPFITPDLPLDPAPLSFGRLGLYQTTHLVVSMRLLVLATSLDRPEAAIFAGLKARGVDVHVAATPLPEHRATLEAAGVPIIELSIRNRFDMRGMLSIRRLVREREIDVVYAVSNRALSTAVLGLLTRRIPIVAYRGTVGHITWFDPSSWFTYLNPRVTKTLCVSRAVEDYLRSVGIPQSRLTTIYKGHDVDWYIPRQPPQRATFNLPDDAFIVGCTAMMRAVKGIDDLLAAVSSLLTELPRLHLLLVGAVKDAEIHELIARFPDPSRIHLTGFRQDATDLARLADVTVMASKNREGFPKSVIEAMSQGVPPIVTAVGGMPELVGNGSAGILVPPENPTALANAIKILYHDEERRRDLGLAARERIKTCFNINDTIDRVHKTLYEVVAR